MSGRYHNKTISLEVPAANNRAVYMSKEMSPLHDVNVWLRGPAATWEIYLAQRDVDTEYGAMVANGVLVADTPVCVWQPTFILPPIYRPMVVIRNAAGIAIVVDVTFLGHCRQPNG